MKRATLPALAIAAVLAWLVGYPLLMTLLEALGGPSRWTLGYFGEFFHRPDEWLALWRSLWISAASVVDESLSPQPAANARAARGAAIVRGRVKRLRFVI